MPEIRLIFSLYFSLIVYLFTFNTNNKPYFLTYMLTCVSNSTPPSFNLCMFTDDDGTTVNNEDKGILNKKKH